MRTLLVLSCLLAPAHAALAQDAAATAQHPLMSSAQDGANYLRDMFTLAAEQMSDDDYTFKPTPEVRSFAQLMAHLADTNYTFCAMANAEKPPFGDVEKTRTTKAEIQKALADSFAYCDGVYKGMTGAKAIVMRQFRGKPRPAVEVLIFRGYHGLLHYGNAITYMRLRGKVPPSTELTMKK